MTTMGTILSCSNYFEGRLFNYCSHAGLRGKRADVPASR
jgi:hypothetical protein